MDIDGFHYDLQYISFPIDPINLETYRMYSWGMVNISTNLKVFGQSKVLC